MHIQKWYAGGHVGFLVGVERHVSGVVASKRHLTYL